MLTETPTDRPPPPAWPSGARGLWLAVTASDPGLARLRAVGITVVVVALTSAVVLGGALLVGGPVTAGVTGVVVAAVTSIGVTDGSLASRAVTTAWTGAAAAAAAALGSVVDGPESPAGVAGFVGLGIAAVFLQRLGSRGFAPGLAGFLTLLATTVTGLTTSGLPIAVGAALLGAATVVACRWLLQPRHPERDARRVLDALETRAAFAVLTLGGVVREEGSDRAWRSARRRLTALRRTASAADDRLGETDTPAVPGMDNEALGVRVFDLRLGIEHLAALLRSRSDGAGSDGARSDGAGSDGAGGGLLDPSRTEVGPDGARTDLADLLDAVGRALLAPRPLPDRWADADARLAEPAPSGQTRLRRTLGRAVEEWRRPPDRLAEDPPTSDGHAEGRDGDSDSDPDSDGSGADHTPPLSHTARRAVQVAVAVAGAALVGQWISPDQWFFAMVIAFVVFISSPSRGAVLSEGWRRTAGTLIGVVLGIGLATALAGNTVATVALLLLCVVGALYAIGQSSTVLMFFITLAFALVYGLIGQFTADVLLIRLAETAAGAGVGIAVSTVVLPTRTRTSFSDATTRFLRAVRSVVDEATDVLACRAGVGGAVQTVDEGNARELRDAYAAAEDAAGPLTDGLAGALDRTGHRDALRVVASCDHHARLLLRLARRHGALLGDDPAAADALRGASEHVGGRVDALTRRLDRQIDDDGASTGDDPDGHRRSLEALDEAARRLDDVAAAAAAADSGVSAVEAIERPTDGGSISRGDVLEAVGARLRAIDRAITDIPDGR